MKKAVKKEVKKSDGNKITKPNKSQLKHIEKPFIDKSGNKSEKLGKIMDTTRDVNHPKGGMVKEDAITKRKQIGKSKSVKKGK